MPVEGLPDPSKHRVCIRCSQWFEPEDGLFTVRESLSVAGAIADGIRAAGGDDNRKFICHPCAAVRRRRKIALYAALGLALVWAAMKEAGWL